MTRFFVRAANHLDQILAQVFGSYLSPVHLESFVDGRVMWINLQLSVVQKQAANSIINNREMLFDMSLVNKQSSAELQTL